MILSFSATATWKCSAAGYDAFLAASPSIWNGHPSVTTMSSVRLFCVCFYFSSLSCPATRSCFIWHLHVCLFLLFVF